MTSTELMSSFNKNKSSYKMNPMKSFEIPRTFHEYANIKGDSETVSDFLNILKSCPNVKNVEVVESSYKGGLFRSTFTKKIAFDYVGFKEGLESFENNLMGFYS